jgi:hypothetical protein
VAQKNICRVKNFNRGAGPRTISVEYSGDILEFTYSREKYTPDLETGLAELLEKGRPGSYLAGTIIHCAIDWNLHKLKEGDENKPEHEQDWIPVPLTEEELGKLSIEGLSRMVEMMAEDNRPNQKTSVKPVDTFSAQG